MTAAAVSLKAGSVALTTLSFSQRDLTAIEAELARKQQEAPALFCRLPCALDLEPLQPGDDLASLVELCQSYGVLPIAVRNAGPDWQPQLQALGLADLGRQPAKTSHHQTKARQVKIHRGNIRSGQQVFSDGDLIVLGMVSAGAEILAAGDIHVYGTLRGRALAGVKGEQNAVIGCQQFDAELVAIAGQYRLFDEAPKQAEGAVVVTLDAGNLNITHV
ncbi:putative septum site-determining protein MinC [Bacterioplanes sanyensis]|uniref:septum site-determining protein MinC n=1 Tax=Bacterioplanes sanyensis TaxID=1249553 RepID=UPI0016758FF5|nr:septum site-determining protein MinC [Bacterioplanes sanyensis]GGY38342.1 putative septum site-determining protein MinC [Bacterioplanes sanyensis]